MGVPPSSLGNITPRLDGWSIFFCSIHKSLFAQLALDAGFVGFDMEILWVLLPSVNPVVHERDYLFLDELSTLCSKVTMALSVVR